MNKKLIVIICSIVAVLIGLFALSIFFAPQKTNWVNKFGKNNKAPFGFYVLYQELAALTEAKNIIEVKHLNDLKNLNPKTDVIFFLDENSLSSDYVIDEINSYNEQPFQVFYAYADKDEIYVEEEIIDPNTKAKINNVELLIKKNKHTEQARYVKFKKDLTTLGTVQIKDSVYANYYIQKNSKMREYTHYQPILFTNFYLLQKDGFAYAKEAFKPFNGKNIYWINPDTNYEDYESNSSALSFIFSQKELKLAWYILLITLFLYLIFKSKREQKIIPIIQPEKNLSLEFANAIASMYYESGQHTNIIKKQIDYFYYTLRKQFNLTTENVLDEHFIYVLAQKAQLSEEETKQMIQELQVLYHNNSAKLKDVNRTYQIIDYYKKKAHII